MTTEEALLAAVWASPHDDLPRLVYADWLDENGRHGRAEFIRVQCELAKVAEDDPRRPELKATETHLWKRHAKSFRKGLTGKMVNESFRRGFVAPYRRMIVLDHFLNWSDEKLSRAPLWEFHVNFRPPSRIDELANSPRLRRLNFLGLWNMNDDQAVSVAGSPHAVNLTGIHCRHGVMTSAGARAIAQSVHLPHLTELILDTARISESLAVALAESSLPQRLKTLDVRRTDLIDLEALVVLRSRFPVQLRVGDVLI